MDRTVLSLVGVRRVHIQKRRANDCILAHRAVVVGLIEHGRVQVFTLRLAAVLAVESVVAVAAVRGDALALIGTVVETGAVGSATVLGRPAVVTRALFPRRALTVAYDITRGSGLIDNNYHLQMLAIFSIFAH